MATKFSRAPHVVFHSAVDLDYMETNGGHDRVAIHWEIDGLRYHVWLESYEPVRGKGRHRLVVPHAVASGTYPHNFPVIYKNPPEGVKHGEPGDFRTRYLDANKKGNAALLVEVFAAVDIEAARKAFVAQQRAINAAKDAELRAAQRQEEAKELLGRLHKYVTADDVSLPLAQFARAVANRIAEDTAA